MSIELRCPGCQNLLRVPETAAGKQARCPQCQQILDVPGGQPLAQSTFTDPPAAPLQKSDPFKVPDVSNPYAASGFYEHAPVATNTGMLVPQRFSLDEALQTTWKVFQQHIGPLAIIGVIVFAINVVQQIVFFVINLATTVMGPEVNALAGLGLNVISFLMTPIVMLGVMVPCMTLLRTGQTVPGDFMKFTQFYGTELLKNFLLGLMLIPVILVVAVPVGILAAMKQEEAMIIVAIGAGLVALVLMIFVFMSFYLATGFIVDRQAGAVESLKLSWQFMNGNRGITFLLMLLVGIVGGLFACCTLGFGSILLTPFAVLLSAVIYLLATGQRDAISPLALGALPPDGAGVKMGLPA